MSTLSVNIPEDLRTAAEQAVASGRFATVSEYIANLIRQDQQRVQDTATEAHLLNRVRAGDATDLTDEDFNRIRRRLDEVVKRRTP
jgi:antitoxin ParD1/3/4